MTDKKKSRGRGRPPGSTKENSRSVPIKIRWTEEEAEKVRIKAEKTGVTFSEYVRSAALDNHTEGVE